MILLAPYKRDTRLSDLINDKRYREMLLKRTGISYSRKKKKTSVMFVVKDIAHRGGINYPEYPSPRAFSARSFLDSTMSCDVTERCSPALSQTSRGQRIKRERLGTRPRQEISASFQRLKLQATTPVLHELVDYVDNQWINTNTFPPSSFGYWEDYAASKISSRRLLKAYSHLAHGPVRTD